MKKLEYGGVAEASGMAQKIIARTSFEATRDLARSDNTALLGAP